MDAGMFLFLSSLDSLVFLKGVTKILVLLSFFPLPYPFTELLFFHSAISNVSLSFKE